MKIELTAERARELLNYDQATGIFTWVKSRGSVRAGSQAGNADASGYIRIRLDRYLHHAHRIAWLMVHGTFPIFEIDHRNGVRSDNRIVNLREATRTQQMQNKAIQSNNQSGFKGVTFYRRDAVWVATISYEGRSHHLGRFPTAETAHAAYADRARQVFGEFARI
ncbi:HNH endonuclease [Burkholderia glumae]|uniref:HNH endonuclease n=1 Tax=Burkholderia glumae TaxID=337 RepID=UPI002150E485|nr:HNH endonuclease [Burkholderia glumae]